MLFIKPYDKEKLEIMLRVNDLPEQKPSITANEAAKRLCADDSKLNSIKVKFRRMVNKIRNN